MAKGEDGLIVENTESEGMNTEKKKLNALVSDLKGGKMSGSEDGNNRRKSDEQVEKMTKATVFLSEVTGEESF